MPTQARAAIGSTLMIGASVVPEVLSIGDVGSQADLVDVTSLDAPGGYSSEIVTIKRNNPIPVVMNYVPGNAIQQQFKAQFDAGTSANYSVVVAGTPSVTWAFAARVSQWQLAPLAVNSAVQVNATLNPDGVITIT